MAKRENIEIEDLVKRYQDLLEIARLVSWSTNRDHLVKTCLDHINQRLGMRARYLLMEGNELKLHSWAGRYECPIEKVPVHEESIAREVIQKGIPLNLTHPEEIEGYQHTVAERVKIKAIIPFQYVDPLTQQEIRA